MTGKKINEKKEPSAQIYITRKFIIFPPYNIRELSRER